MKEDLLHYVWKLKRFKWQDLSTTNGQKIEILEFGIHNFDAGPDFLHGKIRLADTIWAGNIELHTTSSQWYQHGHQNDPGYENVILHVVYQDDKPVLDSRGNKIPTIELKGRIDQDIILRYENLLNHQHWVPCEKSIHTVGSITITSWLERLTIERLERKTNQIQSLLDNNKNDWEQAFYQSMCRSFGLKVNAIAMERLGQILPLKLIAKYKNSPAKLEALFFGQAGMLVGPFVDDYPLRLQETFNDLKQKHKLKPMDSSIWKFMRLRPANFPTLRLAQLAQLIYQSNHLFSKILAVSNVKEIENMFDVRLSNYWKKHYQFDVPSSTKSKRIGKNTIHTILINSIIPFIFHFGKSRKEEKYIDKALKLLQACKAESNNIIRRWGTLGVKADNAYTTQALLQLKNEYCNQQKCMGCAIGSSIVK